MFFLRIVQISISLLLLLTLTSCSNMDTSSSIGKDIVETIDSTAVKYNGDFNTITLPPHGYWQSISDSLSGLHVYEDSLKRAGGKQAERVVGLWGNELFRTFSTFFPFDSIYDADIKYLPSKDTLSIIDKLDSLEDLLATGKIKGYSTDFAFNIDTLRSDKEFFNIKLSTGEDYKDSTKMISDDSLELVSYGSVKGNELVGAIPVRIESYTKDSGSVTTIKDTLLDMNYYRTDINKVTDTGNIIVDFFNDGTKDTISIKNSNSDTINADYMSYTSRVDDYQFFTSIAEDTALGDTTRLGDTLLLKYLVNRDSTLTTIVGTDTTKDTIYDTLSHFWKFDTLEIMVDTSVTVTGDTIDLVVGDTLINYYDSIFIPSDTVVVNSSRAVDTTVIGSTVYPGGDTLYDTVNLQFTMYKDSLVYYDSIAVIHKGYEFVRHVKTGTRGFRIIGEERTFELGDVSNFYISPSELETGSPLFIRYPYFRIIVTNTNDLLDTINTYPQRTNVSVNEVNAPLLNNSMPITSGGTERVARYNLELTDFWNNIKVNEYLSIVYAKLRVFVDTASSDIPGYHNDTIKLRAIVLPTKIDSVGELLKSNLSEDFEVKIPVATADTTDSSLTTIDLDIRNNLMDIMYDSKVFNGGELPKCYLYIWIDGGEVGRIMFDNSKDGYLTYVVQDRK